MASKLPTFDRLINPLLRALEALGGSGSVDEIYEKVITTGTFSPGAVKEALRDGAPPIDLIDGSDLAEKLKELSLGVRRETIEVFRVDGGWFESV